MKISKPIISLAPVARILKKYTGLEQGKAKRVSKNAAVTLQEHLEETAHMISQKASKNADFDNRKTIKAEDITEAIEQLNPSITDNTIDVATLKIKFGRNTYKAYLELELPRGKVGLNGPFTPEGHERYITQQYRLITTHYVGNSYMPQTYYDSNLEDLFKKVEYRYKILEINFISNRESLITSDEVAECTH